MVNRVKGKTGLYDCHDQEIVVGDQVRILRPVFQGAIVFNSSDCQFEVQNEYGNTIPLLPEDPESKYIEII